MINKMYGAEIYSHIVLVIRITLLFHSLVMVMIDVLRRTAKIPGYWGFIQS